MLKSKDLDRFRRALLDWYDGNRRDLPWRKMRDPYRIWLSEIMLQQTRVAAVLEHYRLFLERFPSVEALAAASEDAVLAAWSGLGYYRRARMLRQCAQVIVEQHGGHFPQNREALQTLPGIGRYTSAAIASIAFAEPAAVVDGNVERVLQRLTGGNLTTLKIWDHAQALLDHSRPGDFNQAMMELGARVCVPRKPLCRVCPVINMCVTRGELASTDRVVSQKKKQIWCVLEWHGRNQDTRSGQKLRLVQRPRSASLMAGMWELPQLAEPPQPLAKSAPWRTFRHSITVTNYTVHVLQNQRPENISLLNSTRRGKWIAVDRVPQLPITGLTRKILKARGII